MAVVSAVAPLLELTVAQGTIGVISGAFWSQNLSYGDAKQTVSNERERESKRCVRRGQSTYNGFCVHVNGSAKLALAEALVALQLELLGSICGRHVGVGNS